MVLLGYVTQDDIDAESSSFTDSDLGKAYDSDKNVYDYVASSYSTVEFNNEVANQTVTVYNGTLVLGEFEGSTYEDFYENEDGTYTDLVVDASKCTAALCLRKNDSPLGNFGILGIN